MNFKIKVRVLAFYIYTILMFFDGAATEAISLGCILAVIFFERNYNQQHFGKRNYRIASCLILAYVVLYLIQFFVGDLLTSNLIRLFGLTKCICTPLIAYISFGDTLRESLPINFLMWIMCIFNTLYIVHTICYGTSIENNSLLLNSVNCCCGISVVLLAVILPLKTGHFKRLQLNKRLTYLFICLTLVNVIITDSTTSQVLLIIEIIIYLLSRVRLVRIKQAKQVERFLVTLGIGAVILLVYSIANGASILGEYDLASRVLIWRRVYNRFASLDLVNIIFGTGNDIIQTMTKSMEAHNVVLEITLIYGIVGVVLFVIIILFFLKNIFNCNGMYRNNAVMAFVAYLMICFMHPFYTGAQKFQWICICSIISLFRNLSLDRESM